MENTRYPFKVELHAHNYEESCDSKLTGKELIDAVKEEGYNAIIITNHYDYNTIIGMTHEKPCNPLTTNKNCFECPLGKIKLTNDLIKEAIKRIYNIRKELYKYGESIGIKVYFGNEWENKLSSYKPLTSNDEPNYLIHLLLLGQTNEEFLANPPQPYTNLETLLQWKQETDSLVILNHANRYVEECHNFMFTDFKKDNTYLIDGYEVYNSKNKTYVNADNNIIPFLKERIDEERFNSSIHLSGGDIHNKSHMGKSGLLLPYLPSNERELQSLLRQNNYKLIRNN